MVLEDGVFYQASYDGMEVAITADYPGLLPASRVSSQETSPPKGFPRSTSPTALSRASKGRRSTYRATPGATPKRAAPASGKPSKRKASEDTVGPSSKRYGFANMFLIVASNYDFYVHPVSGKESAGLCPGVRAVILPAARIQPQPREWGPIWE